ncbi:hypothetical protein D9M69_532360 [compost metagenome]
MDGDAVKEVAADGVEVDQHRRHAIVQRLQVADKVTGGDAPEADLAVDEHLDGLGGTFAQGADAVPVFGLQVRQAPGLVEDARRLHEGEARRRQGDGQCQRQVLVLDHCSSSLPPVPTAVSVV